MIFEKLFRGLEVKVFSGSVIEGVFDVFYLFIADGVEVCFSGDVLADKSDLIFVFAPLLWAVGVCKIPGKTLLLSDGLVVGKFCTVVGGDGADGVLGTDLFQSRFYGLGFSVR